MNPEPFTPRELATRLGHSLDWFYRPGNLAGLYAEGMPRPLSERGRKHRRWERTGMEAWLQRYHPHASPPANDPLPLPQPANDAAWRARLAGEYAD